MSDSELEIFINEETVNDTTEEEIDPPLAAREPTDNIMIDVIADKINQSKDPKITFEKLVKTLKEKVGLEPEKELPTNSTDKETDLNEEEDEIDCLLAIVAENEERKANERLKRLEGTLYKVEEGDDDETIKKKAIYNSLITTNSEMLEIEEERERERNFPPICPANVWKSWEADSLLMDRETKKKHIDINN